MCSFEGTLERCVFRVMHAARARALFTKDHGRQNISRVARRGAGGTECCLECTCTRSRNLQCNRCWRARVSVYPYRCRSTRLLVKRAAAASSHITQSHIHTLQEQRRARRRRRRRRRAMLAETLKCTAREHAQERYQLNYVRAKVADTLTIATPRAASFADTVKASACRLRLLLRVRSCRSGGHYTYIHI